MAEGLAFEIGTKIKLARSPLLHDDDETDNVVIIFSFWQTSDALRFDGELERLHFGLFGDMSRDGSQWDDVLAFGLQDAMKLGKVEAKQEKKARWLSCPVQERNSVSHID